MKKTLAMALTGVLAVMATAGCASGEQQNAGQQAQAVHEVKSEFSQELHDALPAATKESGTVSVVGEPNPPWRIVGQDGTVTGFQKDLLDEFSTILGIKFTQETASGLPAVKLGVQSARYDVAFGPLLSNATTQKDLNFIDYAHQMPGFVYSAEQVDITSILGLCESTVAYLSGTAVFDSVFKKLDEGCAKEGKKGVERMQLADFNGIILAVKSNRADFAAMGAHQAIYAKAQSNGTFKNYFASVEEYKPDANGMAVAAGNTELANALFGAWKQTFESGIYDQLMEKYDMKPIMIEQPALHADAVKK